MASSSGEVFFTGFVVGLVVCTLFVWLIMSLPKSRISKYDNAIAECEQNLPRNQHCKIVGVVDES